MTGEGVLWLASARDAFSNRVVGWATAARADTTLVRALEYGLWSRTVRAAPTQALAALMGIVRVRVDRL